MAILVVPMDHLKGLVFTPPKTNMTGWKIHHFEDVFPIEHVDFSNVMLVFRVV